MATPQVTASMYQAAGSIGSAGITRNYQQIPKTPDFSTQFNKVTLPPGNTIQERPNSIIVNKTGVYRFLYNTTASLGAVAPPDSTAEVYISGSEVVNGGPVEIPIQPVAWSNCSGTSVVGEITFVYKGVK